MIQSEVPIPQSIFASRPLMVLGGIEWEAEWCYSTPEHSGSSGYVLWYTENSDEEKLLIFTTCWKTMLYYLVLYDVSSKWNHQPITKVQNFSKKGGFPLVSCSRSFFYLSRLSSGGLNASRGCWDGGHRPPRRTEQFHRGRRRKHGPRFRLQSSWCMLWTTSKGPWLAVYSLSCMLHYNTKIITLFIAWILFHLNAGLTLSSY